MTHPTHGFATPLARDLFAQHAEWSYEIHHCGIMHGFTNRPTTLPTATPKAIQEELARLTHLQRHDFRGKPGEL